MRIRSLIPLIPATLIGCAVGAMFRSPSPAQGQAGGEQLFPVSSIIGDEHKMTQHADQDAIDAGQLSLSKLVAQGKFLFDTNFTELDGRGRPMENGTFPPASRTARVAPENFNRISGPEANACSGCHNKPRSGGGGDNVTQVFVLGQRFSFFDDPNVPDENGLPAPGSVRNAADERDTLGMFGSGAIEMLAREMTADLLSIKAQAVQQAQQGSTNVTLPLTAKGVSFGSITAHANGSVDTSQVQGVNSDLIIRPFSQKAVVTSLREFTNNAFPHHHGLQPTERFGVNTDSDGDGVVNELTTGDITSTVLFQASLGVPGRVIPRSQRIAAAISRGENVFAQIGCAGCHVPEMRLNSPYFTEPNPYNPPGNLQIANVSHPFRFDLTREGELPRLERDRGGAIVRAFTDLKRHDMGTDPMIANERVSQGGVPVDTFITKKLWGFYSEPYFLHNGCATTVSAAILAHGGEAKAARDAFAALADGDRRSVVEFLKSLQVLPAGTRTLVVDEFGQPRPNASH